MSFTFRIPNWRVVRAASYAIFGLLYVNRASASELLRATPEEEGMSADAIVRFVDAAEKQSLGIHSFIVMRHGHVIAEGYWAPFTADDLQAMYSISKSFTSTAVGLAISEGKLGLNDPVLKFFPDEVPPHPSNNLRTMSVRDLLCMETGQSKEDLNKVLAGTDDTIGAILSVPVPQPPGRQWFYNNAAPYVLSAIIQKATGHRMLDYLTPRFFNPLGIGHPTWDMSALGYNLGSLGLSLRTRDIARFGQLYLQGGKWEERQILPEAWVKEATTIQAATGRDPGSDSNQGYGYLFWRWQHGSFGAGGIAGQYCIVMPEQDMVVAMTSGSSDMSSEMTLVWEQLLPACGAAPLASDPAADRRLAARLDSLAIPPEPATSTGGVAAVASRKIIQFDVNPAGFETFALEPAESSATGCVLRLRRFGQDQRVVCEPGRWTRNAFMSLSSNAQPIRLIACASCGWVSPARFELRIQQLSEPFLEIIRIDFDSDRAEITVDVKPDPRPQPHQPLKITGRLVPTSP